MSATPIPPPPPEPAVPYGPAHTASTSGADVETGPAPSVGERAAGFALRTALVVAVTKVLPFVVKLLFRVIFRR